MTPADGSSGPPAVARDAAGHFLVVWDRHPGIEGRRYFADGRPQGPQFTVVSPPQLFVSQARLAMNAAGDYVVSWAGPEPETYATQIYVQSFHPDGTPRTPPLVAGRPTQGMGYHQVAMNTEGRFVVVWNDFSLIFVNPPGGPLPVSTGFSSVHARRFALDGEPESGNILVGSSLLNPVPVLGFYNGVQPGVAMDAEGGFVVAWEDRELTTDTVIYQRRYLANGVPAGLRTQVDPALPLGATGPVVAMDHAGNYMIAWQTPHSTGNNSSSGHDLWARRYQNSGIAQGAAFRVNDSGIGVMPRLALAMDADGEAVVAWIGTNEPLCCYPPELYLQRYSADGEPQGGKVTVPTSDVIAQASPGVAMDGDGNLVVIWRDYDELKGRLFQQLS